jgi:hypothetical protein
MPVTNKKIWVNRFFEVYIMYEYDKIKGIRKQKLLGEAKS